MKLQNSTSKKTKHDHAVFTIWRLKLLWSLVVGCWSFSAVAADWPQFLGPTRNGLSTETNLAVSWPAEGPKTIWQTNIGQGFSGPVVAQGKLILFHRLDDQETIDCLDAKNGKPLWRFQYPTHYQDDFGFDEGPRGTPAISEGKVYTMGAEGVVTCLDFSTGKKIWSVPAQEEFHAGKGFFGMVCSPLVEGDVVILSIGGQPGAGIVAFDKLTGKLRWKKTDDEAGYSSPASATINGTREALVFTRAGLVGLSPITGLVYFNFPWRSRQDASVNAAVPLVSSNQVFITASYGTGAALLKLDGNKVEKLWSSDDTLSSHYATSILQDGFLYGMHGRTDPGFSPAALRCVEWATGKVLWSEAIGPSTVTFADGQLLLMTEKGELLRVEASPKKFQQTAHAQILGAGVRAYPALADGLFYARSKTKLICVELSKAK